MKINIINMLVIIPFLLTLAVGAEREMTATDPARVSDGYVMVDSFAVRESMLIDNNKNIVASFSGDYQGGFTQLLPDGNKLVSSYFGPTVTRRITREWLR